LSGGDLYFNTRNHSGEDTVAHRAVTISRDGGESFESPFHHEEKLVTPIVHASLARIAKSVFFVAPSDWQDRVDLSLWQSDDETLTWRYVLLLYDGPSAYSSMCIPEDGTLGILFEADDYTRILYKSVPLERKKGG
jgi:sialidase-1